jgi:uncharacterized protein involved in response to NO
MAPPGLLSPAHPVWMCAMRPFFLLTMASAVLLIALWSAVLALGLPPPPVAGGALVWHAHELLLGFGLAAVAGFVLTAVPEFTATASASPRTARQLVLLWLLGRAGFWLSGVAGWPALAVAGAAQLALLGTLVALLWPALRTPAGQRHHAFGWALAGMALLVAGFYLDALRGQYPMRWLHAFLGLLMVLIVIAMSRISMRIVNRAIDQAGTGAEPYLARPPRRNLAVLCIALFTLAEFVQPGGATAGWLACASAAALFNLLGDWHVGRPLLRRWPLMLYTVYLCMALGYGLMGWALLAGGPGVTAGRHLLTVGAMGLAIYAVICIAGRAHCGHPSDERPWVAQGAVLIIAGAVLRAGAAFVPDVASGLLGLAGLCWVAAFGLLCVFIGPVLWRVRADGLWGCQG